MKRWSERALRLLARIWIRLLAFNVLLVFLPSAGLLYLNTYERQMLAAQEREMVQQGRLLAAALASPDGIDPWDSERVLLRLHQRHQARLRVVDSDGVLLVDSSALGPQREPESSATGSPPVEQRRSVLYRLGALPFRLYRRLTRDGGEGLPGGDFYSGETRLLGAEVRAALAGRYGATTRISEGQPSVTLYTAIPIRWNRRVLGAVLVSQSTLGILAMLDEVRVDIFRVVLASLVAAAVLSLLVSTTIARPLGRLRAEAAQIADERGRLQRSFAGSRRRDEIGDLSRALEQLTLRLRDHVRFIESFASDVSHEFKNPLAAIRSAAELLADSASAGERERMLAIVLKEVSRMERLLTGVREVTRLDAGAADEAAEVVDLARVVCAAVESASLRNVRGVRVELVEEAPPGATHVRGSSEKLTQVVGNLLDNAVSFAPEGSAVRVELGEEGGWATIAVCDGGPGVPPEHRQRIFDRFFSFRTGSQNGAGHVGLGLSIAQAIARNHGGDITVVDLPGGGARFEVRLPCA
jgi:two-component system sensor histidine kinase ChvG